MNNNNVTVREFERQVAIVKVTEVHAPPPAQNKLRNYTHSKVKCNIIFICEPNTLHSYEA